MEVLSSLRAEKAQTARGGCYMEVFSSVTYAFTAQTARGGCYMEVFSSV